MMYVTLEIVTYQTRKTMTQSTRESTTCFAHQTDSDKDLLRIIDEIVDNLCQPLLYERHSYPQVTHVVDSLAGSPILTSSALCRVGFPAAPAAAALIIQCKQRTCSSSN